MLVLRALEVCAAKQCTNLTSTRMHAHLWKVCGVCQPQVLLLSLATQQPVSK